MYYRQIQKNTTTSQMCSYKYKSNYTYTYASHHNTFTKISTGTSYYPTYYLGNHIYTYIF